MCRQIVIKNKYLVCNKSQKRRYSDNMKTYFATALIATIAIAADAEAPAGTDIDLDTTLERIVKQVTDALDDRNVDVEGISRWIEERVNELI